MPGRMMLKVWAFLFTVLPFNSLASKPPNVLVILGDDVGFEFGAYGDPLIRGGGVDQIFARGVAFERAYTAVSSCSSSRASLLTGLPPHQNGQFGLHNPPHHFQAFKGVKSLPALLSARGIRTGIIGKKHVGPPAAFPFDFAETEENNSVLQVGRNITRIRELMESFLDDTPSNQSFFLYLGIHDAHRCGHTHPQFGAFCELFGDGGPGHGQMPGWTPRSFDPADIPRPYFVQDTPAARRDLAAQYRTVDRLDQGVALYLDVLRRRGLQDSTLILFSSDNGIPFPSGRTNHYDPGLKVPLIVAPPSLPPSLRGSRSERVASLLDVVPTVLHYFHIPPPRYRLNKKRVKLLGKSLLDLAMSNRRGRRPEEAFASHNYHEATMYYPQRVLRIKSFKSDIRFVTQVIHNLSWRSPFPIDQDFFLSPSFQDLLNRTRSRQPTHWYKSLSSYYYRPEWELFDLIADPEELQNLAQTKPKLLQRLQKKLRRWMKATEDPWLCSPDAVLEDKAAFAQHPACMSTLI